MSDRKPPTVSITTFSGNYGYDYRDGVRVDVDGKLLMAELFGSEPEDNSGGRAYSWVSRMVAALGGELGATVLREARSVEGEEAFEAMLYDEAPPPRGP